MQMMTGFTLDLLSFGAGIAVGILVLMVFLAPKLSRLKRADDDMARVFDDMAQESLRKSQDQFLQLAQEKLKQAQMEGSFDLERRQKSISDMVDPIGKSLKDMETKIETLGKAGAGLEAQLKSFSEDQRYFARTNPKSCAGFKKSDCSWSLGRNAVTANI